LVFVTFFVATLVAAYWVGEDHLPRLNKTLDKAVEGLLIGGGIAFAATLISVVVGGLLAPHLDTIQTLRLLGVVSTCVLSTLMAALGLMLCCLAQHGVEVRLEEADQKKQKEAAFARWWDQYHHESRLNQMCARRIRASRAQGALEEGVKVIVSTVEMTEEATKTAAQEEAAVEVEVEVEVGVNA